MQQWKSWTHAFWTHVRMGRMGRMGIPLNETLSYCVFMNCNNDLNHASEWKRWQQFKNVFFFFGRLTWFGSWDNLWNTINQICWLHNRMMILSLSGNVCWLPFMLSELVLLSVVFVFPFASPVLCFLLSGYVLYFTLSFVDDPVD